MARSRWQFSLASLMFVVTICCLSLSLCGTVHQLKQAQQKLEAERFESRFFDIARLDSDQLYGGAVLANCRVQVPAGYRGSLNIQWGQTLESGGYGSGNIKIVSGYNVGNHGSSLSPGLHSIVVKTNHFDGDNGKPSFIVSVSDRGRHNYSYSHKINFERGQRDCLAIKNKCLAGPGLQYFTAKPGEPLELFRMRLMETVEEKQPDGTIVKYQRTPKGPANGILIWRERFRIVGIKRRVGNWP